MEVVLLQRSHLGQVGDVVKVKDGYARNFLFRQNKAVRFTEESYKKINARKEQLLQEDLRNKEKAELAASKMAEMTITISRQAAEDGHLFGSVASRDIVN